MQIFNSKNTRITDAENHGVLVLCSDNQRHLMSLRAARKLENAESAEPWKKGLCTSDFTLMRQPLLFDIEDFEGFEPRTKAHQTAPLSSNVKA